MSIQKFNLRVYGILINSYNQVLLTDELIKGHEITKFPGGGLEFGEGLTDCIKREFKEETMNEVEVVEHFYTTDYFQVSAYDTTHQVISIYYIVKPVLTFEISTKQKPYDFGDCKQIFRWKDLKTISENDFTLPIDKKVGKMLHKKYGSLI